MSSKEVDKLDFTTIKIFCSAENTVKRVKIKQWEKIFAHCMTEGGQISRT